MMKRHKAPALYELYFSQERMISCSRLWRVLNAWSLISVAVTGSWVKHIQTSLSYLKSLDIISTYFAYKGRSLTVQFNHLSPSDSPLHRSLSQPAPALKLNTRRLSTRTKPVYARAWASMTFWFGLKSVNCSLCESLPAMVTIQQARPTRGQFAFPGHPVEERRDHYLWEGGWALLGRHSWAGGRQD